MKFQNDTLFSPDLFLVISVHQERESRSIRSGRRFDDIGNDLLFAFFVEIFEGLAAEMGVLFQIVVRTIRDAFKLAPAHREEILDVDASFGIVCQLVLLMLALTLYAGAVVLPAAHAAREAMRPLPHGGGLARKVLVLFTDGNETTGSVVAEAALGTDVVVIRSLGKSLSMPQLRLGLLAARGARRPRGGARS